MTGDAHGICCMDRGNGKYKIVIVKVIYKIIPHVNLQLVTVERLMSITRRGIPQTRRTMEIRVPV